jgi:hypothetical protein
MAGSLRQNFPYANVSLVTPPDFFNFPYRITQTKQLFETKSKLPLKSELHLLRVQRFDQATVCVQAVMRADENGIGVVGQVVGANAKTDTGHGSSTTQSPLLARGAILKRPR